MDINNSHISTFPSVVNISMLAKMFMMASSLYHHSSVFTMINSPHYFPKKWARSSLFLTALLYAKYKSVSLSLACG